MDDVFDHEHDDVREGGECAFCPNPYPYLQEDVIVPRYLILVDGGAPWIVCFDCFELAKHGADPADIQETAKVSTVMAHA